MAPYAVLPTEVPSTVTDTVPPEGHAAERVTMASTRCTVASAGKESVYEQLEEAPALIAVEPPLPQLLGQLPPVLQQPSVIGTANGPVGLQTVFVGVAVTVAVTVTVPLLVDVPLTDDVAEPVEVEVEVGVDELVGVAVGLKEGFRVTVEVEVCVQVAWPP